MRKLGFSIEGRSLMVEGSIYCELPIEWADLLSRYPSQFLILRSEKKTWLTWIIKDLYGYPRGFWRREILKWRHHEHNFGVIPFAFCPEFKVERTLFIVEGVMDMFSIYEISKSVIALLRNSLTSLQVTHLDMLFKRGWFERVIVFRDADMRAGKAGSDSTKKKLERVGIPSYVFPPPGTYKDVGEGFGTEIIRNYIEGLK